MTITTAGSTTDLTTRTTEYPGYFPLEPETLVDVDAVLFLPHLNQPD